MLTIEEIEKINKIRELCLLNSKDLLKASSLALEDKLDHISFHLSTLALEEIGKISLVSTRLIKDNREEGSELNLNFDDHEKKLFWAIWGPSFGTSKITNEQIGNQKGLAKSIHKRRMSFLYVDPVDSMPWQQKMKDSEAKDLYDFVTARYEMEKSNEGLEKNIPQDVWHNIEWFINATDDIEMRKTIFGHKSQDKLIEFGDTREWIKWLKEVFDENDRELKEILNKEMHRNNIEDQDEITKKWRIKYKLITPSHSIRNKTLSEFNKIGSNFKLHLGGNKSTLVVEMILYKKILPQQVFNVGYNLSRLFTASLNVGALGFFWWNTPLDLNKYYEEIWDLENKLGFVTEFKTKGEINWKELKLTLEIGDIKRATIVFNYFAHIKNNHKTNFVDNYIIGLSMLSKSDIHLRLEKSIFHHFFKSFREALEYNEKCETLQEIKEIGFKLLNEFFPNKNDFEKIIDIGIEISSSDESKIRFITQEDILLMKQSCDLYFIKLSRQYFNSK